jgi:phage terminase large subunit-like protein
MRGPPDPFKGADMGDLEAYLKDQLKAAERDPLNNGYPLSGQQLQFVSCPDSHIIVVAGNRVGKTSGTMRDILWCARGVHPYKQVEPLDMIWCGMPDYPSYLRFTKPAFEEWCPRDWIVGEFHESDKYVDIRRADGGMCRIFFLSYDMPRSKWQGSGVGRIWLDEEPPEDILNECLARIVTTRGSIILTFTPVEGLGFWHDRLWKPASQGRGDWRAFTAALATYDEANEAEFNVGDVLVPHLTRKQIVKFASQYPDPDERAIRIFGLVRSRAGLVFKTYSDDIHYIDPFDVPRHWPLWGGVDPGFHGFAAELYTQDEAGVSYRVAEYYSTHEATELRLRGMVEMVQRIRPVQEQEPEPEWHPYKMKAVTRELLEPTVFFVDTEDPQVVMELNIDAARINAPVAFASLDQGLKARKAGILRMQQLFQPVPDRKAPAVVTRPTPPQGEPMMYLCRVAGNQWMDRDRLVTGDRLAWEIERFAWKPTAKTGKNPDDANDASAGGAHAASAARYATMARLGPPEVPEDLEMADKSTMTAVERMVWSDLKRAEAEAVERAQEAVEW